VLEMDLCVLVLRCGEDGLLTMKAASPDLNGQLLATPPLRIEEALWERLNATPGRLPDLSVSEGDQLNPLKNVEYESLHIAPLAIGTECVGLLYCYSSKARDLGKDLAFDEAQAEPTTHIDSEYSRAGILDPKIILTTSRDPSSKLLQFAKEMRLVFPNSYRINRGNYVVKDLAEACRANDVTDLIVLHEHRGIPDALIVSHFPHGPTLYFTLHNVTLRHDIESYRSSTVSEQYPHLFFENFSSRLGERVRDCLKYLFPVPKEDSKRVMTFSNENDFISFRHHVFVKTSPKEVQLAEVGPRFELKPYEIRQGTIEQTEAEREWVLSHYTRTAKKRSMLSNSQTTAGRSDNNEQADTRPPKRQSR